MAPQTKRPRSTSATSKPEESNAIASLNDALPKRSPHETLWFEDGNIVLATNVHLYRVHKGILAKQSSVFSDMLRIPQPEDGAVNLPSETWEGLPMVDMIGDRDEDLYHLLMAIYERKYYTVYEPADFGVFASLIIMSSKYNFCDIRLELVKHLAQVFPDNLADFDNNRYAKPLFVNPPNDWYFRLLSLAYTLNFPVLLPIIMYFCAVQPFNAIFDSMRLIPGNLLESLLAGRERVLKFSVRLGTVAIVLEKRCGSYVCLEARCKLLVLHLNQNNFMPPKFPLEMTAMGIFEGQSKAEVCMNCTKAYYDVLQQNRQHFWNSLPSTFSLASWADLRQMSVA